jgi:hypothetical protein
MTTKHQLQIAYQPPLTSTWDGGRSKEKISLTTTGMIWRIGTRIGRVGWSVGELNPYNPSTKLVGGFSPYPSEK